MDITLGTAEAPAYCFRIGLCVIFEMRTTYAIPVVPGGKDVLFVAVNFLAVSLNLRLGILYFGLPTDSCGGFSKCLHPS